MSKALEKVVEDLAGIVKTHGEILSDHLHSDKEFHDKMNRVLFGSDEEKEIGIVEMIKTMYGFFVVPSKMRTLLLGA